MGLVDIDRQAVLSAIQEFAALGRERFLEQSGFGPAQSYFLVHDGILYDSKAIVGVAHGFARGRLVGGEPVQSCGRPPARRRVAAPSRGIHGAAGGSHARGARTRISKTNGRWNC